MGHHIFEGFGGSVLLSLIAFSIVFLVLAGLCLVMYAIKYIDKMVSAVSAPSPAPSPSKPESAPPKVEARPKTAESAPVPPGAKEQEEEIVAAIAAAMVVAQASYKIAGQTLAPQLRASSWRSYGFIENLEGLDGCPN